MNTKDCNVNIEELNAKIVKVEKMAEKKTGGKNRISLVEAIRTNLRKFNVEMVKTLLGNKRSGCTEKICIDYQMDMEI